MASSQKTRRSNADWLTALQDPDSPGGPAAQVDLRGLVAGVLRKATASHGSLDDATLDDLTQVATLQILDKLDRFEGRSKFTTWAYSVAVRAALSELRRSPRTSLGAGTEEAALGVAADPGHEPATVSEREEIVGILHRVIERDLTERQRAAVVGEMSGTPQADLLAQLGINRNAFYKLLHDARRKLHDSLCAAGICDDEVREAFDL
ncbi:MAG: RNA polymerase sigma-70 factor (ECF subfamily) [Chlamydiales bacterium]|jgi:RNA polymerase sigma-70 factor (ECF subfamily)